MESDDSVTRLLREALKKQRGYADFFGWPDKLVKEVGIASDLAEALERAGLDSFSAIRGRPPGQDPPDCEATDSLDRGVGIEVTELVDEDAIHATRKRNRYHWAEWPNARLLAAIQSIIARKGQAELRGGAYDRYVLLIHSAEPALSETVVASALRNQAFGSSGCISEAYLLLSYEPALQRCPALRLSLRSAVPHGAAADRSALPKSGSV